MRHRTIVGFALLASATASLGAQTPDAVCLSAARTALDSLAKRHLPEDRAKFVEQVRKGCRIAKKLRELGVRPSHQHEHDGPRE